MDRVAIVTGASRGIERVTAIRLAREDVRTRLTLSEGARQ